ncbi:hypothetical protein ROLI_042300 [Roseobacter fucihabitans]|uniref:Uncharacterized protein n=1 Tax=Roseobacter fucihabitans TaxID=1537242 RepID=A0ABZ2C2S0_9RHOB|nr:hypothetical protein [Roseobacter litoralis]MBC6967802.1 hypothetical protein [Roseobacter litoralis]
MFIAPVSGGCGCDSHLPTADMMSLEQARNRALASVTPIRKTRPVSLNDALG